MPDYPNPDGATVIKGPNKVNQFDGPDGLGDYANLGRNDNDRLTGGSNVDFVQITPGTDTLDGGGFIDVFDADTYVYAFAGGADGEIRALSVNLSVDLKAGTYSVDWMRESDWSAGGAAKPLVTSSGRLRNIEFVVGGEGNDTLLGSDGGHVNPDGTPYGEVFDPGEGDDVIDGRGGRDILTYGNRGSMGVVIDAGAGTATDTYGDADTFRNIEVFVLSNRADVFKGSLEADEVYQTLGGDDTLDGFGGRDTLNYSESQGGRGIFANLADGVVTKPKGVDTIKNFEVVIGSSQADGMVGDGKANEFAGNGAGDTLRGAGGDDILRGGDGNDLLEGGKGNDAFFGGQGADTFDAGAGDKDLLSYSDELGGQGVVLDFPLNQDVSFDTYGDVDTFKGGTFEIVFGSQWGDSIVGGGGNATTQAGFGGDDTLIGGSDLDGGADDDTIFGALEDQNFEKSRGDGADLLKGGAGDDVLTDWHNQFGSAAEAFGLWRDAIETGGKLDTRDLNVLKGEAGEDTLVGVGLLQGGADNDDISGGGVLDGAQETTRSGPTRASSRTASSTRC